MGFQANVWEETALYCATGWFHSPDTIGELIRLIGKKLVLMLGIPGDTALSDICMNAEMPVKISLVLIDEGGKELTVKSFIGYISVGKIVKIYVHDSNVPDIVPPPRSTIIKGIISILQLQLVYKISIGIKYK